MRPISEPPVFWTDSPIKYVILLLLACLLSGCITEAQFRPYRNTLFQLEKDSEQIHKKLTKLDQETKATVSTIREDQANIKADMVDIHTEMQELRGDLSSDKHQEDVKKREEKAMEETAALQLSHLQKKVRMYEERMVRMENLLAIKQGSGTGVPAASKKKTNNALPAEVKKAQRKTAVKEKMKPEDVYEKAYNTYKAGRYMEAREAFNQFVLSYPDSKLVNNAIFWIGETFYRFGDYINAISKYKQVVDKYPKGAKAPDALLKMGFAFEMSGETKAAIATLEKLSREYPKATQVKLANKKIQQLQKKDSGNEVKQRPKESVKEKKSP